MPEPEDTDIPEPIRINFGDAERNAVNEMQNFAQQLRARPRNNIGQRPRIRESLVLDTLGVEFESTGLSRDVLVSIMGSIPDNSIRYSLNVDRDASTEAKNFLVPVKTSQGKSSGINLPINSHTDEAQKLFGGRRDMTSYVTGYELVSVPMNIEAMENTVNFILPRLENVGDFETERCATHIHVGFAKSLDYAKNALALGLYLDPLFFRLSGFGKKFRGEFNHAVYARPLFDGPYARSRNSSYKILNWEQALKATSFYDFWLSYGLDLDNEVGKYHPGRYFAINIYSSLIHGTLEFRHSNQTFNPKNVLSIAKLAQLFTNIVLKADFSSLQKLDICDPLNNYKPTEYHRLLDAIIKLGEKFDVRYSLDSKTEEYIRNLIEIASPLNVGREPIYTHVRDFFISVELAKRGKLKPFTGVGEPKPSGNVDIHNIQTNSILGSNL